MAEFLNQKERKRDKSISDAMNMMGKAIPFAAMQSGYEECKAMGMTDRDKMHECVSSVSAALSRDQPYEAMKAGMRFLDLTGTYRLFAVILCAAAAHEGEQAPERGRPVKDYPFIYEGKTA